MARLSNGTEFYATLQVSEEADAAAIKKAYRRLVLMWHPDKIAAADRPLAEDKIRLINCAYETLSNPTKRERYDLQRSAVDKKKRGVVPKPRNSPKMSTPKEFMMQPIGHPERFLRANGKRLFVHNRQDVKVDFQKFFGSTKFSLWWLPEMNNLCRIRAVGSKAKGDKRPVGAGLAGGLNLAFRVGPSGTMSEVLLAPANKGQKNKNVNFVAKQSPEYEGALRFETACKRGQYLGFMPPSDLRVVPFLDEDQNRVIDFMMVDFSTMFKFIDLEEVLVPATKTDPEGTWVPVTTLSEKADVKSYFRKVLKTPVWGTEDFAAFFRGHFAIWDYRDEDSSVRLRSPEERLGQHLCATYSSETAVNLIVESGTELQRISLEAAARAVKLLAESEPTDELGDEAGLGAARVKLIGALPNIALAEKPEAEVSLELLLCLAGRTASLGGKYPGYKVTPKRSAAVLALAERAFALLAKSPEMALSESQLLEVMGLPRASEQEDTLRPLLAAEKTQKLSSSALFTLSKLGLWPDDVALIVQQRCGDLLLQELVPMLLALVQAEASPPRLSSLAEAVAAKGSLKELEAESLLSLAMATARHPPLLAVVVPIAEAASQVIAGWAADDAVRLLLSLTPSAERLAPQIREALLNSVARALPEKLEDLGSAELLRLILAVSGHGFSSLLQASTEELLRRGPEVLTQPQFLIATQGMAQGFREHRLDLFGRVLNLWPGVLQNSSKPGTESVGQLTLDQLEKLLTLLQLPSVRDHHDHAALAEAVGTRMVQLVRAAEVPQATRALLSALLEPQAALSAFSGRGELRAAIALRSRGKAARESRSRSRSRGEERQNQKRASDRAALPVKKKRRKKG
mmetsp:Transcript_24282/g.53991  ORF Transcript_24282/g.53991 Transcript_24282/m.53991 type:complete len:858 (-) Transcript_24282:63-2636(-)